MATRVIGLDRKKTFRKVLRYQAMQTAQAQKGQWRKNPGGRPKLEQVELRGGIYLDVAMMRLFHRVPDETLAKRYNVSTRTIRTWVTLALKQENEIAGFLRDLKTKQLPEPGPVEDDPDDE